MFSAMRGFEPLLSRGRDFLPIIGVVAWNSGKFDIECWHKKPGSRSIRFWFVAGGFINRACDNPLSNQIIYNRNAMMLLAAFAAKKERIEPFFGVVWQE